MKLNSFWLIVFLRNFFLLRTVNSTVECILDYLFYRKIDDLIFTDPSTEQQSRFSDFVLKDFENKCKPLGLPE